MSDENTASSTADAAAPDSTYLTEWRREDERAQEIKNELALVSAVNGLLTEETQAGDSGLLVCEPAARDTAVILKSKRAELRACLQRSMVLIALEEADGESEYLLTAKRRAHTAAELNNAIAAVYMAGPERVKHVVKLAKDVREEAAALYEKHVEKGRAAPFGEALRWYLEDVFVSCLIESEAAAVPYFSAVERWCSSASGTVAPDAAEGAIDEEDDE